MWFLRRKYRANEAEDGSHQEHRKTQLVKGTLDVDGFSRV
jgi:hypothetical protein